MKKESYICGKRIFNEISSALLSVVLYGSQTAEDKCESDVRNLDIMRTEDYVAEESEWLARTVVSPEYENSKVRIAFCHMPPSPKGWYGNTMVSKYLVICNANQQRMDVAVSEKEIRLDFYNSDGLKLRNLVIPVGKNR